MKSQIKALKYRRTRIFTRLFLVMILSVSFGIAQTHQTAEDYVNRGKDYYDQEKFDLAVTNYTKAIEIDPQDADAYYGRGLAYYDQEKFDLAIIDFTKAIEINSQDADAFSARGLAYYEQEKFDLAIADYTKAIEIDPQDADAYFGRGLGYAQKNYDEAIDKNSADYKRNYDLAIADYTKAIELDPNDCSAYWSRSITYDFHGKAELAKADVNKATELGRKSKEECEPLGFQFLRAIATPPASAPPAPTPRTPKISSGAFKGEKGATTNKSKTSNPPDINRRKPSKISSGAFNNGASSGGKGVTLNRGRINNRLKRIQKSRKKIYKRNHKKRFSRRKLPARTNTPIISQKSNLPTTPVQLASPDNNKTLPVGDDKKDVTGINAPPINKPENSNPTLINRGENSANLKNSIGMEFVNVPTGSFTMGSENSGSDEKPVHIVTISQSFQMSKYEVTQAQWKTVMDYNPSSFKDCPQCPVENVSWDEVQEFISKLNAKNDGYKYRLPTEAEWEYAARAGTTENQVNNLTSAAWYIANSKNRTHPVGQKSPNGWGLYDMHGNVSEWCQNWYGSYPGGNVTDPTGPSRGSNRVYRGSAWHDPAKFLHSTNRGSLTPDSRHYDLGFRIVRTNK